MNYRIHVFSTDLVWLTIQCPELGYPISLPFMRVEQLSADRLLTEIVGVPQTYEEFVIDQTYYWTRSRKTFLWSGCLQTKMFCDLERKFSVKKCFIRIKNKDDLCCARAKDQRHNSIRQGRNLQKQLTQELHQLTGVQIRKCNLEDIKKIELILSDFQIHVIS